MIDFTITSFPELIPLGFAIGFAGVSFSAIVGGLIGSLFKLFDKNS